MHTVRVKGGTRLSPFAPASSFHPSIADPGHSRKKVSIPLPLPERPSLEWLRKTARQALKDLQVGDPAARLAEAQLAVARDYGFPSWRALKRHVEQASAAAVFLRLAATGESDAVRRMLAAQPEIVNATGPHPFWGGQPQALHVAIETRRRDIFDLLLEAGADVNGTNHLYEHWSPLMLAVDRGFGVDELLRRGARLGLPEALLLADDSRVGELLQRGADALPAYAPNGGSILAFARTPFAIDRLLELGASPDGKDRWGTTPIVAMSRLGTTGQTLVRHMLGRGIAAAPEEYARLGDQATLAALFAADPALVRSDAVLMGAVDFRHHALAAWLLENGTGVHARAPLPSRHTALHAAAWNGDLPMVQLLVQAGASLTTRDDEHRATPREWAETAIRVRNDPQCRVVAEYLAALQLH